MILDRYRCSGAKVTQSINFGLGSILEDFLRDRFFIGLVMDRLKNNLDIFQSIAHRLEIRKIKDPIGFPML
jgi:hypothetical protein